jgi:hypothetical protein
MAVDFGFCSPFCKKIFGGFWGNQYPKLMKKKTPPGDKTHPFGMMKVYL